MTITITKQELTEKVGKKSFLADNDTLSAKLNYDSGILPFDNYLNGKTLKQINAVIHLTKYPKGLVIRIAKLFSSFSIGLPYSEIQSIMLSEKMLPPKLIFETIDNGKIVFTIEKTNISDVRQFLDDIHLKYTFETNIVEARQTSSETKIIFNTKHRKK
ncbi:MAG: hypothetical protein NTZ33_06315 [Bacteroidetes bacterium]|nr:hypothetical protein [Bacteroidota bacterium]